MLLSEAWFGVIVDTTWPSCWSWSAKSPCRESSGLENWIGVPMFYGLVLCADWEESVALTIGLELHAFSRDLRYCWCGWLCQFPWAPVLLGTHVSFLNLHLSSVRPFLSQYLQWNFRVLQFSIVWPLLL